MGNRKANTAELSFGALGVLGALSLGCSGAPAASAGLPSEASSSARVPAEASPKPVETPPLAQGAPASSSSAASAAPASAPAAGQASIRMEGSDSLSSVPLVDVVLSGQPTSMLVDTGASHHVISSWFATEASLSVSYAGDQAKDHAGKGAGKVGRVEGLQVRIAGWEGRVWPITLVLGLPDALKKAGIGGVLAPHRAARPGNAVVLDLRAGKMREEPLESALSQSRAGNLAFSGARLCGGKVQGEGSLLAVEATIEGQSLWLKLDTGATQTSLLTSSKVGKALFAKAKETNETMGAAGKIKTKVARGIPVRVGKFERVLDINVEDGKDNGACGGDGFLGLDILSSCVLVLAGEKSTGYCEAPKLD